MKKKPKPESWYEIEEWITPEFAIANIGYWTPLHLNNQLYKAKSAKEGKAKLKEAPTDRMFRLVKVTREVIKENP